MKQIATKGHPRKLVRPKQLSQGLMQQHLLLQQATVCCTTCLAIIPDDRVSVPYACIPSQIPNNLKILGLI